MSFDKIRALLPAFQPQWDIERGAVQLHDVFEQVSLTREQFEGRDYVRLRQIEYLLASGQIDEAYYWRATAPAQPSAP